MNKVCGVKSHTVLRKFSCLKTQKSSILSNFFLEKSSHNKPWLFNRLMKCKISSLRRLQNQILSLEKTAFFSVGLLLKKVRFLFLCFHQRKATFTTPENQQHELHTTSSSAKHGCKCQLFRPCPESSETGGMDDTVGCSYFSRQMLCTGVYYDSTT